MNGHWYFGTNTKMFKTASEAAAHITRLRELTEDVSKEETTLFVIPSFTSLHTAVPAAGGDIWIGAQNIGWEERGQFTGEISPLMLQELHVDMVMVGHSERRHVLHETDFEIEKKIMCAARHGFRTLLCIGETKQQKEYGISVETLRQQLKIGLHSLSPDLAEKYLIIAYEPVWAIGINGEPASAEYAETMHRAIKDTLAQLYGATVQIPVLYGGSVNNENALSLSLQPHIDGLFIGRSAWDADNFSQIIHSVLSARAAKRQK